MLTQSVQGFVAAASRPAAAIPTTPAKNAGTVVVYNVKEVEVLTAVAMDDMFLLQVLPPNSKKATPFQNAG